MTDLDKAPERRLAAAASLALVLAVATPPAAARPALTVAPGQSNVAAEVVTQERLDGPIATSTLAVTISNGRDQPTEARLDLTLDPDTVVGRLALDVDGRWMEGEVLTRGAATTIYEQTVRPWNAPGRDPALLVEDSPGHWTLTVFPVPAGGARKVELVVHRIAPAPVGSVRVEAAPASLGSPDRLFAATPRFARPPGGPPPERIIVALDTSLSMAMGKSLDQARAVITELAARHPVDLVLGDHRARRCTSDITTCLATIDIGGATDLGLLLDEAQEVAGQTRATIVLVSDGKVTAGRSLATLAGDLPARVAAAPFAVTTVAVGDAASADLARLAEAGLGIATIAAPPDFMHPRNARFSLAGQPSAQLRVVPVGDGVVVLGRMPSNASELVIVRTDDLGADRARFKIPRDAAPGFGVARLLGARELAASFAGPERMLAARRWGVATAGAALLVLETDQDYDTRGIVRWKAWERATERGEPTPMLAPDAARSEDRLFSDRDGDGVPDGLDVCPDQPEIVNGLVDFDGCPEAKVHIEGQEIRILEHIYFDAGKALVRPVSLPIVEEIAKIMAIYPFLSLVEVSGHADRSEGGKGRVMDLSKRRADAVIAALVARGVEPIRLVARGRGADQPLTPGRTSDERARNRRVEFRILVGATGTNGVVPREHIARVAAATGLPIWNFERRLVQEAVAAGDLEAASEALERALADAARTGAELEVFDEILASHFEKQFLAIARRFAESDKMPVDGRAQRAWDLLTRAPLRSDDLADQMVANAAINWLAKANDPALRIANRALIPMSTILLHWLGRHDEAERRASETRELP